MKLMVTTAEDLIMAGWLAPLLGCGSILLVACGGGDDAEQDTGPLLVTSTEPQGACGEVTDDHAIRIEGMVTLSDLPAVGADVLLTERLWTPGMVHGTASVGADGRFSLDATDIVSVEDCWGTVLDYVLEARLDQLVGERDANAVLLPAIAAGDDVVDITEQPITLD